MSTVSVSPSLTTTLKNLQAAFNGESNASARYSAFARKADDEGFHKAASLFRAASRAEQIHASNHAAVIKKMGATPEAHIETPAVRSTAENLKTAIAGEEYERDVMYPAFIREAEEQKNTAAVRTFTYALEAEAEHARLYSQVLAQLAAMTAKTTYYVCATCGYTVEKMEFDRCPVCHHPKEKFEALS
ncbi:MAG: rubrerythrin family protein [Terriglobales bacterium]